MKGRSYHIEVRNVGVLEISSDMVITDPCYGPDIFDGDTRQSLILDAKEGVWTATAKIMRQRSTKKVVSLIVTHPQYDRVESFEVSLGFVSVDSGQMSVLNKKDLMSFYSGDTENDRYYDECCDTTISLPAGITKTIPSIVTNTGFGDGNYEVIGDRDAEGRIIRVCVTFIDNCD